MLFFGLSSVAITCKSSLHILSNWGRKWTMREGKTKIMSKNKVTMQPPSFRGSLEELCGLVTFWNALRASLNISKYAF